MVKNILISLVFLQNFNLLAAQEDEDMLDVYCDRRQNGARSIKDSIDSLFLNIKNKTKKNFFKERDSYRYLDGYLDRQNELSLWLESQFSESLSLEHMIALKDFLILTLFEKEFKGRRCKPVQLDQESALKKNIMRLVYQLHGFDSLAAAQLKAACELK